VGYTAPVHVLLLMLRYLRDDGFVATARLVPGRARRRVWRG
jgi:hypothetical protein